MEKKSGLTKVLAGIAAIVAVVAVMAALVIGLKSKSDKADDNPGNSEKAVENSQWITVPGIMSGETMSITQKVALNCEDANTYMVKSDIDNRMICDMYSGSVEAGDKEDYSKLKDKGFRYISRYYYKTECDYVTVVGYNGQNIVSAALVKMVYDNDKVSVTSELEKAYIFEKTDGEYQDISLEYVEGLLKHNTAEYEKLYTEYLKKYSELPELDTLIKVMEIAEGTEVSEIEEMLGGEYKNEVTDEASKNGTITWNKDTQQPYYICIWYENGKCTRKTIKWEAVAPEIEQGKITEKTYDTFKVGMEGLEVLGNLETPSMWATLISYEMTDWETDGKSYPYMAYAVGNGSGNIYVELDMYGFVTDISLSEGFVFD